MSCSGNDEAGPRCDARAWMTRKAPRTASRTSSAVSRPIVRSPRSTLEITDSDSDASTENPSKRPHLGNLPADKRSFSLGLGRRGGRGRGRGARIPRRRRRACLVRARPRGRAALVWRRIGGAMSESAVHGDRLGLTPRSAISAPAPRRRRDDRDRPRRAPRSTGAGCERLAQQASLGVLELLDGAATATPTCSTGCRPPSPRCSPTPPRRTTTSA